MIVSAVVMVMVTVRMPDWVMSMTSRSMSVKYNLTLCSKPHPRCIWQRNWKGGGVTMEGEEDVGKEKREGDGMMESES